MRPGGIPIAADIIVAVATPPGTGAIGIIRVSGPGAIPLVATLVRLGAGRLEEAGARVVCPAAVVDPATGSELDVALVTKMPGPRSYTGEDVVEISCHGNPVLLQEIVEILVAGGARLAGPGEFTRRAYLNGRLDLVQVESVASIIAARTERAVRLAARQLRGGLSREINSLRERLLDLVAALEVTLDFPDDEFGIPGSDGITAVGDLGADIDRIVARARQGRAVEGGLSVMLAGAPNVGKSSLFNALLGVDRAIVTEMPGTTRDLVDGQVAISGVPVRLLDGAGLGFPRDAVDAEGMRRSREALGESDLALLVLDRSRPVSDADREVLALVAGRPHLVVGSKADLAYGMGQEAPSLDVACSAVTGAGIDEVRKRIGLWVEERTTVDGDEGGFVASMRVLEGLASVGSAIREAAKSLADAPIEAVLVDLRRALLGLDETLGIGADESVLDRIFKAFCVGK